MIVSAVIIINSKKNETASIILNNFLKQYVSLPVRETKFEVYWKDTSCYRAEFKFDIAERTLELEIAQFLSTISLICSNWNLTIANTIHHNNFELSCVANEPRLNGINWIHMNASIK